MKIKNQQADALPSNVTPAELGQAMSQLNLSGVPAHKRAEAIKDHFMRIVADSIYDKEVAQEIHISRILRQREQS
jgi:hypothetical protein